MSIDWGELLNPTPRPDRHARYESKVVHQERQQMELCVGDGLLTRCGHLWDYVQFTDDPVTCKTCLRAAAA